MAEIQQKSSQGKRYSSPRKTSTRIDMTAMVDVAFLLLAFFVLTTSLLEEKKIEMNLSVEDNTHPRPPVKPEKLLTLLLTDSSTVHYYSGEPQSAELMKTDFSSDGLRQVVLKHLHKGMPLCNQKDSEKNCWDPIIVFKPGDKCILQNLVDVLDEMALLHVPKYMQSKISRGDSLILKENGIAL